MFADPSSTAAVPPASLSQANHLLALRGGPGAGGVLPQLSPHHPHSQPHPHARNHQHQLPPLSHTSSSYSPPPPQPPNFRPRAPSSESTESSVATPPQPEPTPPPSKRKRGSATHGAKKPKATRACLSCQKAHLTCDDARPCARCVKRGIGDKCQDGTRKKPKYILEPEELEALKAKDAASTSSTSAPSAPVPADSFSPVDGLFNLTFDPLYSFGSEAANLEYSILNSMLGAGEDPAPPAPPSGEQTQQVLGAPWTAAPASAASTSAAPSQGVTALDLMANGGAGAAAAGTAGSTSSGPATATQASSNASLSPFPPADAGPYAPPMRSTSEERVCAAAPASNAKGKEPEKRLGLRTPSAIYSEVTERHRYEEGYHFLIKYLTNLSSRFDKPSVLRIVRALAVFRPSLIALQMPLTEEDEVFVEKCFQRSLIEFERLISFSGTPTAVWRRTGEIVLVGVEFALLSEYTKEDLLGKKTFIYELFETTSAVEYWEKFATHAFESTAQSVHTTCVLLTASGRPVPCTFCFTIKRDVFDLPSHVIGSWLPILT